DGKLDRLRCADDPNESQHDDAKSPCGSRGDGLVIEVRIDRVLMTAEGDLTVPGRMRSPRVGHQPAKLHMRPSPVAGLQFLDVVLGGLHCSGSSLSDMNGTRASVRTAAARRRVDEKSSPPVVLHAVKANARPETPPRIRKKPVRRI